MNQSIRIIFAEDKLQFRKAILDELLIFKNIEVIGEVNNGRELLEKLESHIPDIILLDLDMPVMDGNEAFHIITKHFPSVKIIILSLHDEPTLAEEYINYGVKAYLSKEEIAGNIKLLYDTIEMVYEDKTIKNEVELKSRKYFSLRQKEIIPYLADGLKTKEIAKELGLTESAVEKQKQKIMQKIGANNLAEFYRYVFKSGLNFLRRYKKIR